jgi:hypothetical protein
MPARMSRRRLWIAIGGVLIAIAALVDVRTISPQITIRWKEGITPQAREAVERQRDLRNGEPIDGTATGWEYELHDGSRENISALVRDPAVDDTGNIDREAMTARPGDVRIALRALPFPFSTDNRFESVWNLFQIQSLCLLLAGGLMLLAAGGKDDRRRRDIAVATLLVVGVMAYAFPISPTLVTMGDANEIAQKHTSFLNYAGVDHVRFEAHLSYAIEGQFYRLFGQTDEARAGSQLALARVGTAWFVLCSLALGFLEGWSPLIVRYLGLALLAPSALLYFGWREFGYLSLNLAAYPLIARGLRDGGARLEGGSVLVGLGAALHGWGLVSLAGAWMAALAARGRLPDRVGRFLRITAWATAAYTGWIAVYIIVLKLPVTVGHVEAIPWRPWFVAGVFDGRVVAPIFSATGGRDLLMTAWVVGAPLLVVATSLWRRYDHEVRTALAYALPSVMMATFVWHSQGLNEDMDVVFAVFPALYALAWICAHDPKGTRVAAALLVSGHLAFWRIVLDSRFVNPTG